MRAYFFTLRRWLAPALFAALVTTSSAATLLKYNFETSNPWGGMAGYFTTAGGVVTATPSYGAVGTIDAYGTSTSSGGLQLTVDSSAASGNWSAGLDSGILSLLTSNTRTNPFLTLSFSLQASAGYPVWVKLESYSAGSLRTGGLKMLIYPAAANFYQRFALDLDKMTADGAGVFNPTDPKVRIYFELDNTVNGTGWPNAAGETLQIDNVNYSTPKYYVKPSSLGGNDSSDGLSEATALATIQAAINKTLSGDNIIVVMDGAEYVNGSINSDLVGITKAGTPDAWIVVKNYPGDATVLRNIGWNIFKIYNSASSAPAYIEVRGFTMRGVSYIDANGDRQLPAQYQQYLGQAVGVINGSGIFVEGRNGATKPRHFRFADNFLELLPGGGISSADADRMAIENNLIRSNCWWNIYGSSGISLLGSKDAESSGNIYRNLIQNNVVYGTEGMRPWTSSNNRFSDGNGIILDSLGAYAGRTLIQNNLAYYNGGGGIQMFKSSHCDIIHNTLYHNSNCPRLAWGQLVLVTVSDTRAINNIFVAQPNLSGSATYNKSSAQVSSLTTSYLQNNIYFGGEVAPPSGGNYSPNITGNPLFLAQSIDPVTADFHVHSNSPALNYGQVIGYRSVRDLPGNPRGLTGQTDSGVYETVPGMTFAPAFAPLPGNYTNTQSVTLSCDTPGATIIYTTNNTTPTVDGAGVPINGSVYSGAMSVSVAITFKAIAWKSGLTTSYVQTGNYTFITNLPPCATPYFSLATGIYDTIQTIHMLERTPGAYVRYTTDGSTPTPTSGTIAGQLPFTLTGHANFKTVGYNPESARPPSAIGTGNFSINAYVGNLSAGSGPETFGAGKIRFARFLNAKTNIVTRIFAKVGGIGGSYRAAIYSDNAGVPNALLKASSAAVTSSSAGWKAFPLTAGQGVGDDTYYWLAIWSDDSAAAVYRDASGGTVRELTSAFSSTWPGGSSATAVAGAGATYKYSIYAMTDADNFAPGVNAGIDQSITLPATASLSGTASDDGVPMGSGALSTAWSKVSGPGTVTFANSNALTTAAGFSTGGTYVLRLTATDALLVSTNDMTVTVNGGTPLIATTNLLASSLNPATNGNAVTFTAMLTSSNGPPAGTVTFLDGAVPLGSDTLNGSGEATLTTSALSIGLHSITAAYAGNATYASSTSPVVFQSIVSTSTVAAVTAYFTDGMGASTPQQFSGTAGDGWTGGWVNTSLVTPLVTSTSPLRPDTGNRLSLARTGGSGAGSQEGAYRQWSESIRPTTEFSRLTFDLRLESNTNVFNSAADSCAVALNSVTGASAGGNSTALVRVFGAATGDLAAREWGVFNGDPGVANAYDVFLFRPTGLIAQPGVTYGFIVDIYAGTGAGVTGGKTNGTYDVIITDGTNTVQFTNAGFRSAAYPAGGYLALSVQQDTATDNLAFSVDSIEITPLTPQLLWQKNHFTAAQLANPALESTVWGDLADPDGDGSVNLLEYALGTDPQVFNTNGQPTAALDVNGLRTFTFFRAASDVDYFVEGGDDLSNPNGWTTIATNPGTVGQSVTVIDTAPVNASPRFLRLKVSL